MPRERIPDEVRQAVLADIQARKKSCRQIAKDHGVSPGFVSKLAKDENVAGAFDRERSQTQKGARARAFDAKAARQQAIEDLYGDFQKFRGRVWESYTQVITGPQGPELVTTKLPPLRDQQAGMTAAAICLDKALSLEKVDDDQGAGAGKTMVNDLFGALSLAYHEMVAEEATAAATDAAESTGGSAGEGTTAGTVGGAGGG